jgi:hypothetical protein
VQNTIVSPVDGASVNPGQGVTLTAQASAPSYVASLVFLVNDVVVCITGSPFSCGWTVPAGTGITYTVQSVAMDNAGNGSSVKIAVKSPGAAAPAPTPNSTVQNKITSPMNGATVTPGNTINIVAQPTSIDNTIAHVIFVVDSLLVCDVWKSPFTCPWPVPPGAKATHTIEAIALDNNNSGVQSRVTVQTP